jgi:predicted GNAT superfamily acetyltransferase
MIELRHIQALPDLTEAVRLQKVIWGFEDIELLPVRLFVVATKVGGQAIGAFDGSKMVAFLLAIPGLKPAGKYYLHSHMMGVLADYRNAGVGRMLKLKQREQAMERGIELIEWTFDPLEIKNAFFNIERLGAVVRRYVLNQYGTTTSHLHGGLPTDRCVAEWYISSERVNLMQSGQPKPLYEIVGRISVPADIEILRHTDGARAREIQKRVSDQFGEMLDKGWTVTGFERSDDAGTYLLSPDH